MLRIVMSLARFFFRNCRCIAAGFDKGHTRRRSATEKFVIIQSLGVTFTKNKNIDICQAAAGCDRPVAAIGP